MTNAPTCVQCGRPLVDQAYVCERCCDAVARALDRVALVAGEITSTVAKLARIGATGGGRQDEERHEPDPGAPPRQPAWLRGEGVAALVPMGLPVHLAAADRHDAAVTALTTWARHVAEERGHPMPWRLIAVCRHRTCRQIHDRNGIGPLCLGAAAAHPLAATALYLTGQLQWLRHRPEADEALAEILGACRTLERVVDRQADQVVVGQCACREYLYARAGASTVACQGCGEHYDVEAARQQMREHLAESLFTGAEIATLALVFGYEGKREATRNLIKVWASRGLITAHGEYQGSPAYRFGDVMARLASARSVG